jgi:opacity protein-like surface antigen
MVFAGAGMAPAGAQIIDSRQIGGGQPIAWTSLSVGWLQHGGLCDPDSNSCWDFGSAPQFRASLEMPMGRGASIGVSGTTARVPLTYSGGLLSGCSSCDADANVSQIFGTVHIGGGSGFAQVIDINAGMTLFSNFRATDGSRLDPAKMVSSFSFSVGYGFGYSFSDRMQITLSQDYGLVIHKRMEGDPNNTAQQSTLRVGLRYGLGSKARGF